MSRVSVAEVKQIIDIDDNIIDADLQVFIEDASDLVTEVCTSSILTAARLKTIERWLSAHFIAISDMRASDEKAGPVSQGFQYKVDIGLDVTMYGQQAKRLDISGALARLDNKAEKGTVLASLNVMSI